MNHLKVAHLGAETEARDMAWLHLPIADVSVPDGQFQKEWIDVGEALRALLRRGFDVLIHCRGGLGRAGTNVARLLVEFGTPPEKAILAVRDVRPGAIETCQQEEFVRAVRPVPERTPSTNANAIRSRAIGALVGLAVGDAVGTTLEFTRRDSYPRLTDMIGGGPFWLKPGEWTDDTAMALALADSLAERGQLDPADLMDRFLAWWREGRYSCTGTCFDIGITTRSALGRFEQNGEPFAGSESPDAAGNGSLMRLSPVGTTRRRCGARRRIRVGPPTLPRRPFTPAPLSPTSWPTRSRAGGAASCSVIVAKDWSPQSPRSCMAP